MPNCNMYFNIFFGCISEKKMRKLGLRARKSFVEIKPVSVFKHDKIGKFIFAKVV